MIENLIIKKIAEFYLDPREINNGYCADFADAIWRALPEVQVWADCELGMGEYRHTFIEFDGLYYDAECPKGVYDWRLLPIYQRTLCV